MKQERDRVAKALGATHHEIQEMQTLSPHHYYTIVQHLETLDRTFARYKVAARNHLPTRNLHI